MSCFPGPMSFMFIQTFGCRAALICGSLIMATGYMISAFTTSLEALFFTYGVVVGKRADTKAKLVSTKGGSPASPFFPQLRNVIAHFIFVCLATFVLYMWNRHDIDPYNDAVSS